MSGICCGDELMKQLILALPEMSKFHRTGTQVYSMLSLVAKESAKRFGPDGEDSVGFGPFGQINFPYFEMGEINSLHLFGLDELIIFSFYYANRNRYKKVADLGANIGLHSIALSRCGFDVRCYEPDPVHFKEIEARLNANNCANVSKNNSAVSIEAGEAQFVRVLGNTTSSHLHGAKDNAYGELETFSVKVEAFAPILEWADFIKMDVEGHEATLIASTTRENWLNVDVMMEVGNPKNAQIVFEHLQKIGVNIFGQKIGWEKVTKIEEMPVNWRDGSLFVSMRSEVPWN